MYPLQDAAAAFSVPAEPLFEFSCDAAQDHFQFAHQIIFHGQSCGSNRRNRIFSEQAGILFRPADPMLQLALYLSQLVHQAVAIGGCNT